MLSEINQNLMNIVSSWGYGGIIFFIIIECVIVPIPSEVIMGFAGYLVYKGVFNLWIAVLTGAIGSTIGCLVIYVLSRKLGVTLILKYGKYLGVSKNDYDKVSSFFNRKGKYSIFLGQILPGIRSLIAIPAGVSKMPIFEFISYVFLGSFIWCFILTYFAMKLGENWKIIINFVNKAENIVYILLAIFISVGIWYIYKRKIYQNNV